ncbi:MAG: hypothetical protein AB7P17_13290 [Nitrospirales bacterium]|nr:hypothetical protein [Nitrospirales bacterium]
MMPSPQLLDVVSQPSMQPIPEGIEAVARVLIEQYGQAALGILFYGSCLRAHSDQESLVDCYVLVENYSLAFSSTLLAFANWLLPPNVFFLSVPFDNRIIRIKYAVLSLSDFERSVTPQWFHSYFWARFAQPTVLMMATNPEVKGKVFHGLAQAVQTFLEKILPRMTQPFTAEELWEMGLMLTYGAELRSEPKGRVRILWAHAREHYEQVTRAVLIDRSSVIRMNQDNGQTRYTPLFSARARWVNRAGWGIRRIQGKLLSILRLVKAAFTFQGGADYLVWKIERHSGVKIELTPAQRRHPIWTGLTTFWRLYRQGAFR